MISIMDNDVIQGVYYTSTWIDFLQGLAQRCFIRPKKKRKIGFHYENPYRLIIQCDSCDFDI